MNRRTVIRIDVSALQNNLSLLKRWTGDGFFCPMVKANAYGHGEFLVARVAEEFGVSALGVALIEEGMRLRQSGIRAPILAFSPLSREGAHAALEFDLTPVVGRFLDFEALDQARGDRSVRVHIKVNTGMQRLGFDEADTGRLRDALARRPWLEVAGVCTHLTHGEEAHRDQGATSQQIQLFERLVQDLPGVRHLHKSSSMAVLQSRRDKYGARPGISLYGLPHSGHDVGPGLRPALTWQTEITHIHRVASGQSASYSSRFVAKRDSWIGVIPMGYGDGYMRQLSNKGQVLVRGQRVAVVGSVCMDYVMVDLTDLVTEREVQPGEPVVVLGRQGQNEITAAEIADWAGTIAYEVVTNISARVPREAV